jgi:hypothetical protein
MKNSISLFFRTVWVLGNPTLPFDRANQVARETTLEQYQHFQNGYEKVLIGRFDRFRWYSGEFLRMLRDMENPRLPFDRAHRVRLATGLEHLEHVPERMLAGFSR